MDTSQTPIADEATEKAQYVNPDGIDGSNAPQEQSVSDPEGTNAGDAGADADTLAKASDDDEDEGDDEPNEG